MRTPEFWSEHCIYCDQSIVFISDFSIFSYFLKKKNRIKKFINHWQNINTIIFLQRKKKKTNFNYLKRRLRASISNHAIIFVYFEHKNFFYFTYPLFKNSHIKLFISNSISLKYLIDSMWVTILFHHLEVPQHNALQMWLW